MVTWTAVESSREIDLGVVASVIQSGAAPRSSADAVTTSMVQPAGEDALSALLGMLRADLDACNHTIVARMNSPVALIPQLAAHIVAAGGKRLRPLLTLACARLCGYAAGPEHMRHVNLAACV